MRVGDVANAEAQRYGKPLEGVRVLAIEQMQALPWGTQLLARLGADVVKIESPKGGDQGRSSLPAMADPEGRPVGAQAGEQLRAPGQRLHLLEGEDAHAVERLPGPRGLLVGDLPEPHSQRSSLAWQWN